MLLTGINDKMAEYTNSAGVPSLNAALMHTLQRHRDILQDYTHEFHKTKANFLAIRERENLLGSVRKDIESYKSGSGVNNRRTELFLKEHEHLRKQRKTFSPFVSTECGQKGGAGCCVSAAGSSGDFHLGIPLELGQPRAGATGGPVLLHPTPGRLRSTDRRNNKASSKETMLFKGICQVVHVVRNVSSFYRKRRARVPERRNQVVMKSTAVEHCHGNKRKYDFPERDVEVNTKQDEYLGNQ
ncbi:hypothetical protein IHE44_0007435 [Lamprotornis superbus]|uniref:Golgi SNAP receptor complex member 1 n=1 Tax=Lamprotornis superbus TaxID=245042 RepID=A0A835NW85_9PASS|nr:hypothetical protein IHE44_0007435 [Lamprotornis superbus]